GAADEDAAFERVFERAVGAEAPGDGGDKLVFRGDGFFAGVLKKEATGAVGVFRHAGAEAGLAEERGLLVAGDACDRHAAKGGDGGDFAEETAGWADRKSG